MPIRSLLIGLALSAVVVNGAGQRAAIASIHVYQRMVAPVADRIGARCRFVPSCSHYAEAVITREGLARGGWKTLKRIARCGPWTPPGTRDDPR